jgi:hypothetical protein
MSNENMTSLFSIRRTAHKTHLKAKEIREQSAAYFLHGGGAERQNDCT